MAEDNTFEEILKKLQDAAKSSTKQQGAIAERYSKLYEKFLKGELAQTDLTKWTEFWLDEAKTFALAMTDISLIYYKVMLQLNDDFSERLEKIATEGTAPQPVEAPRPAAASAAKRSRARKAARPTR